MLYELLLCAWASTHWQCKNQSVILASAISQISFRVFRRDVQNIDFPDPGIILTIIMSFCCGKLNCHSERSEESRKKWKILRCAPNDS